MKMKSLFSLFTILATLMVLSLNINAQDEGDGAEKPKKEKKAKKKKKVRKPLEELSHSGTVTKKETKKGDRYFLKTADAKINLPRTNKKAKEPVDYSKYLDKKVTIKGKGFVKVRKTKKGERTYIIYKRVTSIEESGEAEGEKEEAEEEKKEEE